MSHILFAWELGGNTGHLHHVGRVAMAMRARGHRVTLAARNLADAHRLLGRWRFPLLQAPVHLSPSSLPPSASFAEMLFRVGYAETDTLAPLLEGWRRLIGLAAPDMVVGEHSPTALLAARTLGVKRAAFGTGFTVPPLDRPMPSLQPWAAIPGRRLAEAEARCVAVVNQVSADVGTAPIGHVADLFDADARFLVVHPELNSFGPRTDEPALGPTPPLPAATDAAPAEEIEIFAYFAVAHPLFRPLLAALAAIGRPALIVARDAPPDLVARTAPGPVRVVARQVEIARLAPRLALAINYGSPGAASEVLAAGRPLLCFPLYVEQYLLTRHLADQGLAPLLPPKVTPDGVERMVRTALADAALAENARAFAARHAGHDAEATLAAIADRLDALVRTGAQSAASASSVST